jgi:hypothetical protein
MKNQNSISKPTVIIKPPPSVSAVPSAKKDKLPIEKKMDLQTNPQQQSDDNNHQQNHDFVFDMNEPSTTADTPSTPLTDKVKKSIKED